MRKILLLAVVLLVNGCAILNNLPPPVAQRFYDPITMVPGEWPY